MNKTKYKYITGMNHDKFRELVNTWVSQDKCNKEIYALSKIFFKVQPDRRTLQTFIRSAKIYLRDKPFMNDLKRWQDEIKDKKEINSVEDIELDELYKKGDEYKALL